MNCFNTHLGFFRNYETNMQLLLYSIENIFERNKLCLSIVIMFINLIFQKIIIKNKKLLTDCLNIFSTL